MADFLIPLGLFLFALGCRTFQNRFLRKLGLFTYLAVVYTNVYAVTHSHAVSSSILALCLIIPSVSLLITARKLRIPIEQQIKHRFPPSAAVFPQFNDLCEEIESSGFKQIEDTGWSREKINHFIRIFINENQNLQLQLNVVQQDDVIVSYINITTRTQNDISCSTTNFPFGFMLKAPPEYRIQWCHSVEDISSMLAIHQRFLQQQGVTADHIPIIEETSIIARLQSDLNEQIHYNLQTGFIASIKADSTNFGYTWKGCWFLWCQMLKSFARY